MRYVGWINASPQDRHKLRSLGVEGKVIYNYEFGGFEYCNCAVHIVERLIKELPGFWPASFTALNLKKKQLPKEAQKYWGWGGRK